MLVDGTVVASGWTQLTSGTLSHAIDKTELGGVPPVTSGICGTGGAYGPSVFTGTDQNGNRILGEDCKSWASASGGEQLTVGDAKATGTNWTRRCSKTGCDALAALYCLQQ